MADRAKLLLTAIVALSLAGGAGTAWSKGPKVSKPSSTSKPTGKPAEKESSGPSINIDLSSRGGSSTSSSGASRSMSAPAGAAAAVGAGAAAAAIAPGGPKDTPEEARKRLDQREEQLKDQDKARARQRAEDEKLAAFAVRERERKAAEAEKERIAKQQRAQQALGGTAGGCVFKPVMTDAEIAACRK